MYGLFECAECADRICESTQMGPNAGTGQQKNGGCRQPDKNLGKGRLLILRKFAFDKKLPNPALPFFGWDSNETEPGPMILVLHERRTKN